MSLSDDILDITTKVTREWTKQRKAEERGRPRSTREYIYSDRVNFTDVMDFILPPAYRHASGDGQYSVSKRQFYYACRDTFKNKTARELEYKYFAQTLLVQYMNRHPETAAWKVTADPRGTLTIPNTGPHRRVRVPVGTLQIEGHLREAAVPCDPYGDATKLVIPTSWPSLTTGQRYRAVLYIEKEGFEPLLQEARIAERFDLAIISCKGQSVGAARRYVDEVCAEGVGVPLLVAHDLDKYGFEIAQRLTTVSEWAEDNDRVIYKQFENEINVIDLGLRLADVEKYGLVGERCKWNGYFASDSIATEKEKAFLRSGRRVELNEFTSPQFIEWLEAKLTEHLPGPFFPDGDVLENAYRRALAVAALNQAIDKAREDAITMAKAATVPKSLLRKLTKAVKASPQPWDLALYELAREVLEKNQDSD